MIFLLFGGKNWDDTTTLHQSAPRQALPDALHLTVAGETLLQGKTLARDVDPDECLC